MSSPNSPQQVNQSNSSTNVTSPPIIKTPKEQNDILVKGRLVARRPIRRRTTKREARQLRNGVCSDGEACSSDEDGYIQMNPQLLRSAPLDQRGSGYYLKILPSQETNSRDRRALSEEPLFNDSDSNSYLIVLPSGRESPDSPDYVPMDSWKTDNSTDENETERDELYNWVPILAGGGKTTPTQKEERKSPSLAPPPTQRTIKYSDVTIQPLPPGLPRKPSKPQKFKYETVDLKETLANENQLENHIYYKTTTSVKKGEMPSVTRSLPCRQFQIHSYVEIDTDDIEQMSLQHDRQKVMELSTSPPDPLTASVESSPYKLSPPTVPYRPDDLDGWVESNRQHVVTGINMCMNKVTLNTIHCTHTDTFISNILITELSQID